MIHETLGGLSAANRHTHVPRPSDESDDFTSITNISASWQPHSMPQTIDPPDLSHLSPRSVITLKRIVVVSAIVTRVNAPVDAIISHRETVTSETTIVRMQLIKMSSTILIALTEGLSLMK